MEQSSVGSADPDMELDAGFDYDATLYEAIVHECTNSSNVTLAPIQTFKDANGHKMLNTMSKPPAYHISEKQLRDAAAKEVARLGGREGNSSEDHSGNSRSEHSLEAANPRKRKLLTADEKTKQNRDRNRDHAKNTRLRKKAYVIKLKELVDQLTEQKTSEEVERKNMGEKIHETHLRRKNAVRMFLKYRALNLTQLDKW